MTARNGLAAGPLAKDPRVGPVLRGQRWVQLEGAFTVAELRALADLVEAHSSGMERAREAGDGIPR